MKLATDKKSVSTTVSVSRDEGRVFAVLLAPSMSSCSRVSLCAHDASTQFCELRFEIGRTLTGRF